MLVSFEVPEYTADTVGRNLKTIKQLDFLGYENRTKIYQHQHQIIR